MNRVFTKLDVLDVKYLSFNIEPQHIGMSSIKKKHTLLTAEAQVRPWVSPSYICGGESGTTTDCFPKNFVSFY